MKTERLTFDDIKDSGIISLTTYYKNENNNPISVPDIFIKSTAINGIKKSKKKDPKLLYTALFVKIEKSSVKILSINGKV